MVDQNLIQELGEELEEDINKLGVQLARIEYVHEEGNNVLRFYISKEDGYVSIQDCEDVSLVLSDRLDEIDPIESSYLLEVSSLGIGGPFESLDDFERNIGKVVEIIFYGTFENHKRIKGILLEANEEDFTVELIHQRNRQVKIKTNQTQEVRLSLFDN